MRIEVAWLGELDAMRRKRGREGVDGRDGKDGRYGGDGSGVGELRL
jgi:hypothetical protein